MLMMSVAAALAADLPVEVLPEEASGGSSRSGGSTSGTSSGTKSETKSTSGGEKGKKKKFMGWTWQPYVAPGGGAQIDASGTSIVAGAEAGIYYWKKKWTGNLYVGGDYVTGTTTGYEARLGNTIGRREKYWGLDGGLELMYNGYSSGGAGFELDPSAGLAVPVKLTVGPKKVYGFAGVAPAILFTQTRSAPSLPAPIDELEWTVGAGMKWKGIRGEVSYTSLITASGTVATPAVSLTLGQ